MLRSATKRELAGKDGDNDVFFYGESLQGFIELVEDKENKEDFTITSFRMFE